MFGYKTYSNAGYECVSEADGKRVEHDLKKCVHCGNIWRKRPGSGIERGFCTHCMGDCCSPQCGAKCYPFEKKLMDESKALQIMNDNPMIAPSDAKLSEIFNRLRG